jgi:signal transduction histidine kinase
VVIPLIIFIFIIVIGTIISLYFVKQNFERRLKERDKFLSALHKLYGIMVSLVTLEETAQKLTDAIAFELGFEAGVLSLIDDKTATLKRVAVSHTRAGLIGIKMLPVPYKAIGIPLEDQQNILIKAIRERKPQITKRMFDLFVPSLPPETVDNLQRLMNIRTSFVYPIFSKNRVIGTMIFSIAGDENQISAYQRDAVSKIIEVVGLVIDRIYLYEELAETSESLSVANVKLTQLDKLKDDFVSIASHELRTPMTAIRSYVWMALNRPDITLSDKMKKYLGRTLQSTERLINLVNDMLNVSRIEAGRIEINPQSFNIVNLAKEVMEEVKPKADEKAIKLFVMESQMPSAFGDPDKIHEVLLNLVGNALKFTPNEGTITIGFFSDGKTIETSVKDSGVGISKEDLARLFRKFERLDSSYMAVSSSAGTGLGLYISKSLVTLMNGKIWANSEGVGKGTTFTFSLPLATADLLAQSEKFHIKPADGEAKGLEPTSI